MSLGKFAKRGKKTARKLGQKSGRAARACKGKKGKEFHLCRSAYYRKHARKSR